MHASAAIQIRRFMLTKDWGKRVLAGPDDGSLIPEY